MSSSYQTYKGKFYPKNPSKYQGDPNNIVYRSSWERMFMGVLDENTNILKWSSEELSIKYFDPTTKKMRKYYPDFIIIKKKRDGSIVKEMIEIKPLKQTMPPQQKRKTKNFILESAVYAKNVAKWEAAKMFCLEHGIHFRIITEVELGL
jgi:hypothetical protein